MIKIQNNLPTTTTTAKTTTMSIKTTTKTPSRTTTTFTTFEKEEFKPKCDEYERDVIVWVKCGKIRTEEEMIKLDLIVRNVLLKTYMGFCFWLFYSLSPAIIIVRKKQKH